MKHHVTNKAEEQTVTLTVSDAPDQKRQYADGSIRPEMVVLKFRRSTGFDWNLTSVHITGPQVRKDGSLGVQRTEKLWSTALAPWLDEVVGQVYPQTSPL